MIIQERIRELRTAKQLSQGDIEERTGMLRCYISRVENGHTIPSIETLEKFARALEVPMYQLFYDGEAPPPLEPTTKHSKRKNQSENLWGNTGPERAYLMRLRNHMATMQSRDRKLLLHMARKMSGKQS